MDGMQLLWYRIEVWMRTHAPIAWQELSSGATSLELQMAEDTLEVMFPEDFKASYLLHNGGYTISLVTEMSILSLEDIVSEWQLLKDLKEAGTWDDRIPYYFTDSVVQAGWHVGPIQPVWWDSRWIPFARDRAGNMCCLDLNPINGGIVGQVIDWDHEVGPSRVLFSSFFELLSTFANDLEAGKYVDTDEGLTRSSVT